MPVMKQIRVVVGNSRDGIRLGDRVTLPKGIHGIIDNLELKTSYQYVTLVGGTRGRFPIGAEVNVDREVPTDDERDAEALNKITERVSEAWAVSKKHMESELKKLNEEYKTAMSHGYLDIVKLDRAFELKLDSMRYVMWEQVRAHIIDVADREDTPPGTAALRAVMRRRHECEEQLTKPYQRALSRSTSVPSNLEEDMLRQVQSEFLEETKWWGCDDLWERVGSVL